MIARSLIAFACILLVITAPAMAVTVVDGDTIKIDGVTYRLNGIDAPEHGQKCKKPSGKTWPCGKRATAALGDMVVGSDIRCEGSQADGYGRTIATCYKAGIDLNRQMVLEGWAWAFLKYSQVYAEEQKAAQSAGIGIWQAKTQTPWDYRAERWNTASQQAPDGCPIKGNISRNGQIYHAPWSPWYKRTKINLKKGERWFCSEADAVAAGWRAPYWGR